LTPEEAAAFFVATGEILAIHPLGLGNINETFLLRLQSGEQRVLQRLRPEVFSEPAQLMVNLELLLRHTAKAPSPYRQLRLHLTRDGRNWLQEQSGGCWRMFDYIEHSWTISKVKEVNQAREIGAALGWFHRITTELDPVLFSSPLPDLHNTTGHLADFSRVLATMDQHTVQPLASCCDFIEENLGRAGLLEKEAKRGVLGKQVIHGDPKCANFLFDEKQLQVLCLIDLDTAGSGLLLHDIGDSLRSCCNPLGEECENLQEVYFDMELFAAWLDGYCSRMQLAPADRNFLVIAVWTICFELGVRFLTDYLRGNPYFTIRYPEHNLNRCRIQFELCRDLLHKETALHELVVECVSRHSNEKIC
jgi:Ser/Thr protein kinase RdoA (MazF antagonist)